MLPQTSLPLAEIALNSEPVKYLILALTAPMWIPFFKALWHTLNDGLREEGGLLGRPPTEEQLLELEQKYGPAAATLISVPKEGPRVVGRAAQGQSIGSGERGPAAPASRGQDRAGRGAGRARGNAARGPSLRGQGGGARSEGSGRGPGPRRFR